MAFHNLFSIYAIESFRILDNLILFYVCVFLVCLFWGGFFLGGGAFIIVIIKFNFKLIMMIQIHYYLSVVV